MNASIHSLSGRVAIVSGAGQGIGAGVARALAAAGASVVIAEINAETGAKVADEIGSGDRGATFIQCDVRDEGSIRHLVAATIERYSRIDILVNNVGWTRHMTLDEMSGEDWDNMQRLNLGSMFQLTKACLPHLRSSRYAAVVNVSSIHANTTLGGYSAYAASKAGIVGFTKSLAVELAPGIRVNAALPGAIMTEAWQDKGDLDAVLAHRLQYIPLSRMGEPADIGNAVAFLASDAAAYISGTTLAIDGGMSAQLYDGKA